MSPLTYELRLLLTFVLSFVFGLARQRAHKPIGFGTFTMVATGACGLAITALLLTKDNPLPLLNGIITGIGSYQRKVVITASCLVEESEVDALLAKATRMHKLIAVGHHQPQNTVTFTYLAEGTKDTMTALPATLTGHDWFDSCTVE